MAAPEAAKLLGEKWLEWVAPEVLLVERSDDWAAHVANLAADMFERGE
ncbi:hypothetical protein [Nocardioides sp. Arc9.136]|nr:hypothetical protein [Nocardioides sp. Arc9.136]WKN48847.1 hypothetical protein OSR43_01625 [Nocardioides sp. Arc9.136]